MCVNTLIVISVIFCEFSINFSFRKFLLLCIGWFSLKLWEVLYLIILLWLFKDSFDIYYIYVRNIMRPFHHAHKIHFIYTLNVWMLWYRPLTLCQMKQLWTVTPISHLILALNLNRLLHGTHKQPCVADHFWSIYRLLSCIWTSIRMLRIKRTTVLRLFHAIWRPSASPCHPSTLVGGFTFISTLSAWSHTYVCLIVGTRKV